MYVVVNIFISGNLYFSLASTSLAYITVSKNKKEIRITWDKKINYNTHDTHVVSSYENLLQQNKVFK